MCLGNSPPPAQPRQIVRPTFDNQEYKNLYSDQKRRMLRRGLANTIKTSAAGDTSQAVIASPTLLGGSGGKKLLGQ